MLIQIRNWEKYNPRKDIKRSSWFRLEHDILTDPDFYSFTGDEFRALIYVFCEQSRAQGKPFRVNPDHAERSSNVKRRALNSVLEKLKEIQFIHADDTRTLRGVTSAVATDGRTDERNERTDERDVGGINPLPADFPPRVLFPDTTGRLGQVFLERGVTEAHQKSWVDAFPELDWVREEIFKALAWEAASPRRKKKRFAAFITSWLTRGWDRSTSRGKPAGRDIYSLIPDDTRGAK